MPAGSKDIHGLFLPPAFEAGTVGGLADWFAVSALFREIPIPIIRRHTNIIVKNRHQLTEGVVDLVTNRWLSPDVIREKLSDVPIAEALVRMLQEPLINPAHSSFCGIFLVGLQIVWIHRKWHSCFKKSLKIKLKGLILAAPLGPLARWDHPRGEHHQLWDMILNGRSAFTQ